MDARSQQPTPITQLGSTAPPSYIKSTSYFSPRGSQCCQCRQITPEQEEEHEHNAAPRRPRRCSSLSCEHSLCHDCDQTDVRGAAVIPHSFPANWVCSSCGSTHLVLDILTREVSCACGFPTLQAVYDQFGRLFLFWRDDPEVFDMSDPAKVQEAAWRIWEAGGEPWLGDVLRVESERERNRKGWSRLSQSSLSSEASVEVEVD